MIDPLLTALLVCAPLALILYGALTLLAFRAMFRMRPLGEDEIRRLALSRGDATEAWLGLPWEKVEVESPGGYRLALRSLRGEEPRVAIFHHGITSSWVGMLRYMDLFIELGWTVVALDSRGHGSTGGGRPSYGVREREDLRPVVDWALGRFPASGGLVLVGESMGAASVLQYAPLDARVDAVVADCSYSSAAAELEHGLARAWAPAFLRPLLVRTVDRLCRRRDGFSLYDAAPERAILRTSVPILLVHGLEDAYVPWRMSLSMAERRRRELPGAITELRLVPGARHGRSVSADRAGYAACLASFLAVALAARGRG